jgi:stage II sporulation protein GA (sporulation sigma-E factor processing peptidase)
LPYVYADLVLVVNLVMNYFLLSLTAALTQARSMPWRLGAGSLLGGLYALAVIAAPFPFLTLPIVKIFISLAMVVIAFGPGPWQNLLSRLACFYLLSFLTGGAALSLLYSGAISPGSVPWWSLPAAAAVSLSVVYLVWNYRRQYRWQRENRVKVRLRFGSAWVEVPALVDTGNQLWEPLSNRPVIILENKALSGILPPEVEALCRQERMDWGGLASISNPEWAGRCRLVPFSGLGIKRGLLLGLRPDEVSLFVDGKWVGGQPALVGLVNQELGCGGNYRALVPPDLFVCGDAG